ncbi:hypothetical protein BN440_3658 [Erwinia amylovora MR1]|nr:hypothetical protein BN440_3658 [Erwinia amylovora MR1]
MPFQSPFILETGKNSQVARSERRSWPEIPAWAQRARFMPTASFYWFY